MIMGQSNMAAGANIGSITTVAGMTERWLQAGFLACLQRTLKYDCKFASYVLIAKGEYPHELNIPFHSTYLVQTLRRGERVVMPAYWLDV